MERRAEETAQPTPSTASYPFNLDTADIILRSTDTINFHVHRAILSIVSPVFATMFQLPQPQANDQGPSLPILDVSEDSRALDMLLRQCYPVEKPVIDAADVIISAFEAAKKYDMGWPTSVLSEEVEKLVAEQPLHAWAVSCRLGSEDIARSAAISLLRTQVLLSKPLSLTIEEAGLSSWDGISSGNYYRLSEFLRRGGEADQDFRLLSTAAPVIAAAAHTSDAQAAAQPLFASEIPYADARCRSADGVEFQVHRAILMLRSVTFQYTRSRATESPPASPGVQESADALRSPEQRQDPGEDPVTPGQPDEVDIGQPATLALPTLLHFDGDARTLSTILAICYGMDVQSHSLSQLAKVLAACHKYGPGLKTVLNVAERLWDGEAILHPMDAYFVAVQANLESQARAAAKQLVSHVQAPTEGEFVGYTPLMETQSALVYHRLLLYLQACEETVRRGLEEASMNWRHSEYFDGHVYSFCSAKKTTHAQRHLYGQGWLITHLAAATKNWRNGADWSSILGPTALLRMAVEKDAFCWQSRSIVKELFRMGEDLPTILSTAVGKVALEMENVDRQY
ncbi:hypothetical protein C8Q77DRAFT_1161494 [Trametes polyzona]|nr:hypothetical protein C8Q77DRAFT_1161494 [Trametes polyzona]